MKHFYVFIIIILFSYISYAQESYWSTQQPGWIVQDLPVSMTGAPLADRGDDLIVFTQNYSDIIYFFDISINIWTEVNLGSQQTFEDVMASGNTAFAYSDEYLVAYSSVLSQWDTVKYEGNVLDPSEVSTRKGYGCGAMLAYFITDANIFYVFDSELAQWQQYNFGLVSNTSGYNDFWAADIYAGAILQRNGNDYAKNIAYSLITHSFADLDQGGWYYYPDNIMHGGYVASWNDANSTTKYFGYCAATNQFNTITFPFGLGVNNFEAWINQYSYDRLEDIYVYTCGYEVGDQTNRDVTVKSYSTKTGQWYTFQYSYDPRDLSGTGWKKGGSFSIGYYINDADQSVGLWKFYGNSGTHIGEIPDLFGGSPIFACGGKVAVGTGEHNLWFHNFETGYTKNKYFAPNQNVYYTKHLEAENYCCVFRVNTTSDTMRVFFFNGNTNNLQSIETYKLPSSNATATPRVYGYVTGGPENDVIFYSEELDSVVLYKAVEAYGGLSAKNYLMVYSLPSSTSVIFDASTAQIYEKNFALVSNAIGNNLIFTISGNMELTAYSGITKNWSVKQTNQILNGYTCGDEVAFGYSASYAKYWAYSAYDDTYYALEPEGSFVNPPSMAGGKTALVIRTEKIYAFSPGDVSPVEEDVNITVNSFSLSQNYPNPFNPSTIIKYTLGSRQYATLKVYDVLGNEVATLVNEELPPGEYEVEYNVSNLSSGIYFYRLNAGSYSSTKKMLLLK